MLRCQSIIASASKRATPVPLRSTKAAIAICAVLLPVFCFGSSPEIDCPVSVWPYRYPASGTSFTKPTLADTKATRIDVSAVSDYYFNNLSAVRCGASGVLSYPGAVTAVSAFTNATMTQDFCIRGTNNCWYSLVKFCPDVVSYATIASRFVVFGYTGSGVSNVHTDSSGNIYFNMLPAAIFSDVLYGTNTLYRQILVNNLSSISGSLVNIGSSVGTINNDYRTVNDPYLNPSYSNMAARASYLYGPGAYDLDLEQYIRDNPDRAPETVAAVLENSRKNIGFLLNACNDPNSSFYGSRLEDLLYDPVEFQKALSAGGGGNFVSQIVSDSTRARQAGDIFNKGVIDRLSGITSSILGSPGSDVPSIMGVLGGGSGVGGIAGDVKRLSTNDWVSAVTNRLAQNTRDIKDALANMFGPVTNDVRQSSDVIKDELPGLQNSLTSLGSSASQNLSATRDIKSHLETGVVKVDIVGADIGFHVDSPLEVDSVQWEGISMPLSEIEGRLEAWHENWKDFYNFDNDLYRWQHYYDMVARIEASITNSVPSTNEWDRYYFKRFKRADTFRDNDDQSFKIDDVCDLVFGNGFDIGEYDKLNWFSRVELLLYKFTSVTNTLETTDITSITNEVNTLNLNVTNFVNASVKVVGVFKLIDGFAKSMRSAFSGSSTPLTSGVVLLEAGHWIGEEALVLQVPVEVQNALRLVFECIWYLSAFVVGWRILVWSWDKIVSMLRWLWSLIDI